MLPHLEALALSSWSRVAGLLVEASGRHPGWRTDRGRNRRRPESGPRGPAPEGAIL